MTANNDHGPAEDLIDIAATMPWWLGLLLAAVGHIALDAWSRQLASSPDTQPAALGGFLHAFALTAQYGWPSLCVTAAAMSAWRRRQRKR